ncbi:MAG: hypothetical protein ACRDL5_02060, partial [Solirubrobacteraceae bacterium]
MAKKSRRKPAKKRQRPGGSPARAGRSPADRELQAAIDEIRREAALIAQRAAEAQAADTSPKRVAEIVAEDFDGMASPVGLVDLLVARGSAERARAVVAALAE